MGTVLEIEADSEDPSGAERALEGAFAEVRRLDRLLSNWREDSEISRLNRSAYPESSATTREVAGFLRRAKELSELTGGRFDVTIEPLSRLWNLRGEKGASAPPDKEAELARLKVNHKNLEIYATEPSVRFLVEGMGVDAGGIGKGHALDRALEKMKGGPIERAVLNFGGEILYWSREPSERLVAVRDPVRPGKIWKSLFLKIPASTSSAVATSGNAERPGHLLDPRTGRPAEGRIRSATVVAPDAVTADALSTALFVMGLEEAKDFSRRFPDYWVLLLYEKPGGGLSSFMSGGWAEFLMEP